MMKTNNSILRASNANLKKIKDFTQKVGGKKLNVKFHTSLVQLKKKNIPFNNTL